MHAFVIGLTGQETVISRLLLVEDDPALGSALKRALEAASHVVDWVVRGEDAIAAIRAEAYGLVLLDLGLPDMDGLDVIRAARSQRNAVRIIIITAQDRTEQRVKGLDAGADDYLVKPVDVEELAARVRSQLRRADGRDTDLLSVRDIAIDLAGQTVSLNGQPVAVTAKEYKVLALLMRRAGQFITKSQIETALYDNDRLIESNTVEVAVSSLRRKLGREAIVTARGLGYMVAR